MHDLENESEALVEILNDATAEPIMLSYDFLENITDNFSKDLEIGTGGFGVVYMGIVRNMKVAIKKLSRIDDFSEKQFEDELKCLKRVKHKNIVRFLGYCSDTPKEVVEYKGAYVLAECRKRLLCFEYAPNKSLEDYIKDESRQHDWDTCYHLIEGICQGLHYLHNKERINHLDLKPANILLDADMVPKISDFGLSRRFSGEQSRIITEHVRGTPGYIAPEYIDKGEISFKTDIYSLGIIIRKLLMGRNNDLFDFDGIKYNDTTNKVTGISSLEFCFSFEPNKRLHCPITLTNMTDHYAGVWITPISANNNLAVNKSFEGPCSFVLMRPNSTWVMTRTPKEQQQQLPSQDTHKFKMVIIIMGLEIDLLKLESSPYRSSVTKHQLLKLVIKESLGKLSKAMVSAAIDNTANCKIVTAHQAMSPWMSEDGFCMAMDVHPIEPWIIMGHAGGFVSIWNYKTQGAKEAFRMTTYGVCSVKFIAKNQSFAVAIGDTKGWIHVFNNSPSQGKKKFEKFSAHPDKCVDSLAVHPTFPILLSSSCEDNIIKRWDWHQGWSCTRIFEGHTSGVRCLTFNPRDTNIFASIGVVDDTKVWNINSSNAITLSPMEPEKADHFFTDRRNRNFLISCDDEQTDTAEIWDMQTKDHLQTLSVFMRSKLLKNGAVDNDPVRGNSSEQKSGHGSEIPAPEPINMTSSVKNTSKKDFGTKENNHGGRGRDDHANNATGAIRRNGAGNPAGNKGKDPMGSAPTSKPTGHPNSSMPLPSRPLPPLGTVAAAEIYYSAGGAATYMYDLFRDDNVNENLFSDENPNSCCVM